VLSKPSTLHSARSRPARMPFSQRSTIISQQTVNTGLNLQRPANSTSISQHLSRLGVTDNAHAHTLPSSSSGYRTAETGLDLESSSARRLLCSWVVALALVGFGGPVGFA
jgi:hypothetical protein